MVDAGIVTLNLQLIAEGSFEVPLDVSLSPPCVELLYVE